MLLQGRAVHDVGGCGDVHEVPECRNLLKREKERKMGVND